MHPIFLEQCYSNLRRALWASLVDAKGMRGGTEVASHCVSSGKQMQGLGHVGWLSAIGVGLAGLCLHLLLLLGLHVAAAQELQG